MIAAATYARKSTKDDRLDADKSVVRQLALAREFAERQGWTVVEEYVDDGVSGRATALLVNRARLLADATAGKFAAVIVRDFDRISRDDREGPSFVYMLRDAGVEVWEYNTGAPIKVDRALDRTLLNMKAGFSAHEAEEATKRTREQKFDRARRGAIADGRVLGYRTVGEVKSRRREIDPEQAKLVVRIFELAAAGKGYLKIARTLNAAGVKNPCGQDRRNTTKRTDAWSSGGIKAILARELYHGKLVYGRTRNVRTGGRRKKAAGEAPITVDCPDLRIVSDSLWHAANERMASSRAQYLRSSGGRLYGKPGAGSESKHLLAGLLQCGVCGGNMFFSKKTGQRGRPVTMFVCSNRRSRGAEACSNSYGVPAVELTGEVARKVKHIFLNPVELGRLLVSEIERRAAAPDALKAQREELTARMTKLAGEIDRLADIIADGAGDSKALVMKLRQKEAEHRDAAAALEHANGLQIEAEDFDVVEWLEETRELVDDLKNTMDSDPAASRLALKHLLTEPIVVTPRRGPDGQVVVSPDGEMEFEFKTKCSFVDAPLDVATGGISAPRPVQQEVTGRVTRRAWSTCPRGDSNTRHAV